MPDYDAKNIPVLDDVIENGDDEKKDFDLSAGSAKPFDTESDAGSDAESYATENNLELLASETIDLAAEDSDIEAAVYEVETLTIKDSIIENTINPGAINPGAISPAAEPQIGPVDNISNEDGDNISLYSPAKPPEDEAEKFESALIDYTAVDETETSTIDMPATNKQEKDQSLEANQQTSTAISLQSVTDDIVKQLMPKLEQQLRLLLEQALKEKLPEDIDQTEMPSTSNPDN